MLTRFLFKGVVMGIRVNVDGCLGTAEDRLISPLDLGFVFGASVYETLRTYGGRPFLLDKHLARLRYSAESLKITPDLTDNEMVSRISETMAAANNPESLIRIILSAGVGVIDYGEDAAPKPTLVILVKPLPNDWERTPEQVVRVALVDVVRNHPRSVNPRIKSSNLLNNLLATREARSKGAEEAIMLNYRGEVAEGALTNVFIVKDRVVKTPTLETTVLAGITRGLALELAKQKGFETEECVILPDELFQADEAFLTGTTKEVIPIVAVNDCVIGNGTPGPVTMTLFNAYREMVKEVMDGQEALKA
jgi:branched-chain amino acid aminotransferase